jgi:hypothetical protein
MYHESLRVKKKRKSKMEREGKKEETVCEIDK